METTKCRVICIYTPKPEILEGFEYNMEYQAELFKNYVRLFPDDLVYYETCSMRVFRKHFKIIKECYCEARCACECACGAWDN